MAKSEVHLVKLEGDDVHNAMSRLLSVMTLPAKWTKPIGIKINLCDYRKRETGVTTDPLVLDPLLRLLRERYPRCRMFLFENDATGTLADNLYCWLGLEAVARQHDVEFINLSREEWEQVLIDGYRFKEIEVPQILQDAMIVNHPKMKTHGRTKITCGLKNMYGCYRLKNKVKYHRFLDDAIVDINMAVKSRITIVDGFWAVEGNRGPTQGFPKKVGVLVGGNDVVAVDAFCARFMGFTPWLVRHIVKARKKGLGSMKYELHSEIARKDLRRYRFEFNVLKYWLMEVLRRVLR